MSNSIKSFDDIKKIHFVGVGGIGLSRLAKYFALKGKQVSGSDIADSPVFENLKAVGVDINISHDKKNIPSDTEVLIYSSAIGAENIERQYAIEQNIAQLEHFEAIAILSKDHQTIAIAGTHGKSTVTTMIGFVLEEAGLDPTVFVGSRVKEWGGNVRIGQSDIFVVEADELNRQFLHLNPKMLVINNIEPDHLDYYKDFADIASAFSDLCYRITDGGVLFYNSDDFGVTDVAKRIKDRTKLDFGKNAKNLKLNSINTKAGAIEFEVVYKKQKINLSLKVPGEFNVYNSLAAISVGLRLNIAPEVIKTALERYHGIWRRFEILGNAFGAEIVSDYGHHPSAITATMKAAVNWYAGKRILLVYQPHQKKRTQIFFNEFVKALSEVKSAGLWVVKVFDVAGRDDETEEKISSLDLVQEISKKRSDVEYLQSLTVTKEKVSKATQKYDVIIFMGAGDIYKVAEEIVKA
ncbi:MAG: UDP-N-acetylmuramate--L-alanine ligase [Candidatus Doudnabacteria bacterium CG10_big_fil_rev_8_21_14_0_10_41_10]|uniref:UDP-N-acetylmuramate--L-alanine ligase n=1 Tax=Candidatus Doudnabacteria bacterium CG10_big_fil_rev_8_21_14_0_10_41_10 TaxID=1974551 RepID=A0A2H0VF61_9BACT|nr:MAG: UDP-N-acetylmuramate--L-alanine ligase [Candidatus Doudnabacteria bacterium CG10_big_fil_rev_8_21_14_0_10_41_10]